MFADEDPIQNPIQGTLHTVSLPIPLQTQIRENFGKRKAFTVRVKYLKRWIFFSDP